MSVERIRYRRRLFARTENKLAEKEKGSDRSEPFLILILAATYVPAQLPAQYHRPCKA
jgi:hypothetical protein